MVFGGVVEVVDIVEFGFFGELVEEVIDFEV